MDRQMAETYSFFQRHIGKKIHTIDVTHQQESRRDKTITNHCTHKPIKYTKSRRTKFRYRQQKKQLVT